MMANTAARCIATAASENSQIRRFSDRPASVVPMLETPWPPIPNAEACQQQHDPHPPHRTGVGRLFSCQGLVRETPHGHGAFYHRDLYFVVVYLVLNLITLFTLKFRMRLRAIQVSSSEVSILQPDQNHEKLLHCWSCFIGIPCKPTYLPIYLAT